MSKALVAYFSASGVTAKLAKRLANGIGADVFEIVPAVPYTEADLDWRNSKSRSSVEMNDRSCRPPMASTAIDMAQYDVVFVGFPVWWYREPSIIDTFLESFDFSGKTIVPFATSGSSGIGSSGKSMREVAPDATVLDGLRFDANATEEKLVSWASEWL